VAAPASRYVDLSIVDIARNKRLSYPARHLITDGRQGPERKAFT